MKAVLFWGFSAESTAVKRISVQKDIMQNGRGVIKWIGSVRKSHAHILPRRQAVLEKFYTVSASTVDYFTHNS